MRRFATSTVAIAITFDVMVILLPKYFSYSGSFLGLIGLSIIFGLVNGLIGPIVRLLALPIRLATLGLFSIVINAGLLVLAAGLGNRLGIEFHLGQFPPRLLAFDTLVAAVVGSVVLGVVNALTHHFTRN